MEWARGPLIGQGSSATVSLATVLSSGELIAVKSAEISRSSLLQKERCLISQLSSPYVVKCLGSDITCENKKSMYNLFVEYVPGGTLSDLIKNQGGSLEECLIQSYVHQVLRGLDYLHSNGVVHCDIKGQNILIGKDGAKIADFGCAKLMQGGDMTTRTIFSGTPAFMAPEVARSEAQGFPADIWALGCTIIEMTTGTNPWPEANDPVSAIYRIGYSEDVPACPEWLSTDAKDFLSKCLMRNAKERWTARQLLQHKFLDGLKADLRTVNELYRNSPTSILDQDIWESLDVSETSPMSTHNGSSLDSPGDRIRRLIGDGFSSGHSNLPNWVDEEDWFTIRGTDDAEPCTFSTVDEDELEQSIAVENYSFDYFTVEISPPSSRDTQIENLMMSSGSVNHVLVTSTVDFESNIMESFCCSVQNFPQSANLCFLSFFLIQRRQIRNLIELKIFYHKLLFTVLLILGNLSLILFMWSLIPTCTHYGCCLPI